MIGYRHVIYFILSLGCFVYFQTEDCAANDFYPTADTPEPVFVPMRVPLRAPINEFSCADCNSHCWSRGTAFGNRCINECGMPEPDVSLASCSLTLRQPRRNRPRQPQVPVAQNRPRPAEVPQSLTIPVDGNLLMPSFMRTTTGEATQFDISCRNILGLERQLPPRCRDVGTPHFQNECLIRRRLNDHTNSSSGLSSRAAWAYHRQLWDQCANSLNVRFGNQAPNPGSPPQQPTENATGAE